jgi:uncharacterized protein YecE (DUF72 family)
MEFGGRYVTKDGMIRVGTSGWSYKHWINTFYPKGLAAREQLVYLARQFDTVELNASFYRLPGTASFAKWHDDVPADFRFAVKVPRTISHYKRLGEGSAEDWAGLLRAAEPLANKISVYLCQLPPSLRADEAMLERLAAFGQVTGAARVAYELRHMSWFEPAVLEQLARLRVCVVQAESSRYPHTPAGYSPAPFAYYRFHGPRELYGSQYTDEELDYWAGLIRAELAAGKDVYAYFDNDFQAFAIEDAKRLRERLG